MTRRARIVATIGPASREPEALARLMAAGMDVARLNLSHGSTSEHASVIRALRRISRERKQPVAVVADLPGPKIRSGRLEGGRSVLLSRGSELVLTSGSGPGSAKRLAITHPRLARDVRPGNRILLADGLIEVKVIEVSGREVRCKVVHGGRLGEMKGVNLPGVKLSVPSLTAADRRLARFALEAGADYLAQSFVRSASDVRKLKALVRRLGSDLPVLAKIEKPEALEELEQILDAADGVMVARGDLGVEMKPEKVPAAQKRIIRLANERLKPVITATQMLESMMDRPRPTRAEASDVANAVLDGTDAVMLSGETAAGRYPVESVEMMSRIVSEAESIGSIHPARQATREPDIAMIVAEAAAMAADRLPIRRIVVFTESGSTARLVSMARPTPPIEAYARRRTVRRRLPLLWGVSPHAIGRVREVDQLTERAERDLLKRKLVRRGDLVVIVAGTPLQTEGSTNLFKLHTIGS